MLFATALLNENARYEQLEAMRQMMIESRAIADAAERARPRNWLEHSLNRILAPHFHERRRGWL